MHPNKQLVLSIDKSKQLSRTINQVSKAGSLYKKNCGQISLRAEAENRNLYVDVLTEIFESYGKYY